MSALCGAGLPHHDGDENWFWCTLKRGHSGAHTDGERSWTDEAVIEVVSIIDVRAVPSHQHDFVGDQDTCVGLSSCPLTWGEYQSQRRAL